MLRVSSLSVTAYLCAAALLMLPASKASADPTLYSTSGSIPASNEPDPSLHGLTGASLTGAFSTKGFDGVVRDFLPLGSVKVSPTGGFDGISFPNYTNEPFTINVSFNNGLPGLSIKGGHESNGRRRRRQH